MATCAYQANATRWQASYDPLPALDGSCVSGSTAVVVSASEYQEYMLIKNGDISGINSADAFYAFSWGFGVVALFWSFGYFFGTGKHAIKIL